MNLKELFPDARFEAVSGKFMDTARAHLDNLTKPRGSLGQLEDAAARLFAIGAGREPIRIDPAILFTVAADHGIAAQGVSPYPQAVTRQMAANILHGGAAVSVLCRTLGITCRLVDAGILGAALPDHAWLIKKRLASGTCDMTQGPAMSQETCIAALRAGFAIGREAAQNGFACIAAGELGIANSSAAAALYCALLGLAPEEAAGPGSGADGAMLVRKKQMVAQALAVNNAAIASGEPLAILAAVGGLEIACLAGLMLACAAEKLPLVVDGFICAAAYAAACAFYPDLKGYAFLAHSSAEPGFALALARLHAAGPPLLSLNMRLGEGTGAALAIPLLRCAAALYNEMATFASANVSTREQSH